jgi:hypothetical protein
MIHACLLMAATPIYLGGEGDAMRQKLDAINAAKANDAKAITRWALKTAAASEMPASTGEIRNDV